MRKILLVLTVAALAALSLPATAGDDAGFGALAAHYEPIRKALLHDTLEGVRGEAAELAKEALALEADFSAERAGVAAGDAAKTRSLLTRIATAAAKLAKAGDVDTARDLFAELSAPLIDYADLAGSELAVGTCPMAGESWLQPEGTIGNPYMGQRMAQCGNLEPR